MKLGRHFGIVASLAGTLAATSLAATSLAAGRPGVGPGNGQTGDPQPQPRPVSFGLATSPGSVAVGPDGSVFFAYDRASAVSGVGRTVVCLLNRRSGRCGQRTVLSPLSGDTTFGTPQVFVTSAGQVVVLQETCCDSVSDTTGDDLVYTSADGGKTFAPPVRVGTTGVDSAALAGDDIVFIGGDDGSGAQVQSVQVAPAVMTAGPVVTTKTAEDFDVSVTSYRGGVLVASDSSSVSGGSPDTTNIEYANSAAAPFVSASSFLSVGTFGAERLLGVSGRALLTLQVSGQHWVKLRLFNGRRFGAPANVPGTAGRGPKWYDVDTDPSGVVHVFTDRARGAQPYQLLEYTTSNGSTWAGPVSLGDTSQLTVDVFAGGLDALGSGLVVGTEPAWGYLVLGAQSVTFSLKPSAIRRGTSTTGSGKASPATVGRVITLQVQGRTGRWFNVATTREHRGGLFSFTIKGKSAGAFRYRAVVSDVVGYMRFGYSNAKQLRVR